jgi:protein-S-isoprenylcysteine O-methyltransferase Ste14
LNTQPVRVIAPPPLIYLAVLGVGVAVHFLWEPWRLFPVGWIGHAAGWPVFGVALLLFLWSLRTFARQGEDIRIEKPTNALVNDGPYCFSRNPIYGALTLAYAGISLIVNTIWPLVGLPLVLAVMHYGVIRREERYLEGLFGDQYRQYQTRVRRWL